MKSWSDVANELRRKAALRSAMLVKYEVEHPRDGGMSHSVGLPLGQRATFLLRYTSGETLLVDEFDDHYRATLHRPRPASEALLQDAPGSSFIAAVAIGGLLGLAIGRSGEGALIGALAGGAVGLTGVALANAESRPVTSRVAEEALGFAGKVATAGARASEEGSSG